MMRGASPALGAAAVAAALVLAAPATAEAQSTTEGFHFGANLHGAAIHYESDGEPESGPGLGLELGYGVSRMVTLYLEVSGANVETYDGRDSYSLGHADLGVRLNLGGPERSVLGYFVGALNGRAANIRIAGDPFEITGAGLTLGGGLLVFLNRSAALDFGLRWTGGSFSDAEYRGRTESIDLSANSARLNIGFAWWAG